MENIVLTQKEFDNLLEYSCSLPTGTTIGKKWKKGWPYYKPTEWYLCEYIKHDDPDKVGISYKRIVAVFRLKNKK